MDSAADLDSILLRDLVLHCLVGVTDAERLHRQPVTVNVEVFLDLHAASVSDDLVDTLDYAALYNEIVTIAEGASYVLLERLLHAIVRVCFTDRRVVRVAAAAEKQLALSRGGQCRVQLVRSRSDERQRQNRVGIV